MAHLPQVTFQRCWWGRDTCPLSPPGLVSDSLPVAGTRAFLLMLR